MLHFLINSSYEFTMSTEIQHQVHKIELYKFIPDQVGENLTNSQHISDDLKLTHNGDKIT